MMGRLKTKMTLANKKPAGIVVLSKTPHKIDTSTSPHFLTTHRIPLLSCKAGTPNRDNQHPCYPHNKCSSRSNTPIRHPLALHYCEPHPHYTNTTIFKRSTLHNTIISEQTLPLTHHYPPTLFSPPTFSLSTPIHLYRYTQHTHSPPNHAHTHTVPIPYSYRTVPTRTHTLGRNRERRGREGDEEG